MLNLDFHPSGRHFLQILARHRCQTVFYVR